MTKTRKQRDKLKLKRRQKRLKGGKSPNNDTKKLKMFNGILYSIKLSIAKRIASLLNSQVLTRINDRVLVGLPPILADQLKTRIDNVAYAMVSDMAKKGMDMGENVLKAAPGFGNALSLVAAMDKGLAAMKNARESVERIAAEIEQIKGKLRMMGIDPDKEFPVLNSLPTIPQIPFLDTIESFFDFDDNVGDINIPSVPNMPNMTDMTNIPNVPNVPNVPNMTNMTNMPNMGNIPNMPNKNDILKMGNLQKGGRPHCNNILDRVKRNVNHFNSNNLR